jgi:hypothetical protein
MLIGEKILHILSLATNISHSSSIKRKRAIPGLPGHLKKIKNKEAIQLLQDIKEGMGISLTSYKKHLFCFFVTLYIGN